ncbi:hypothetical protein D3Z52_07230 [Clostridiaceae bacterium]|nr:hypothetical protein [Clostridiaceae bacterium]
MATRRKTAEAAEVSENAEAAAVAAEGTQDGAELEPGVNTTEEENAAVEAAEAPQGKEGRKLWEGYSQFVYIGPSIPGGLLKKNAVLIGEFEQIKAYLAPVLEKYPQAEKLLYPTEKAGYAMRKIQAQGNIVHKCYMDLVSLTNARMKEE